MAAFTQTVPTWALEDATSVATASVVVHSGRAAVLSHAPLLEDLAVRSGQPGAMHGLMYLLDHTYASRKLPHLVLFFASLEIGPPHLLGFVLLFEYRIGPWKTGFIATGDSFGVRTVIGPEPLRPSLAAAACAVMLERRARFVLVSFKQSRDPASLATLNVPEALWGVQTRSVRDHLPLAATYDATLARMGKRTRTHLRYYRRRLEQAVPCEFLGDVTGLIDAQDAAFLKHLNRRSLGPLAQRVFNLQYRSTAQLPGGFVCGLRSRAGQWLSLAGGWRQGDTTWIQWQMNSSGFESFSLSTVFRSFLIEAEVARGTRRLAFHGGTSHSMAHAFPVETVVDLVARRSGLLSSLLVRLVPRLEDLLPSLQSRGNFLADVLRNRSLRWHPPAALAEAFRLELERSPPVLAPSNPSHIG